jgi:hypothetical protein
VPTVLTPLAAPDPDDHDRDDANDYVAEQELRDLGIDPALVRICCPHATELRALGGSRCWPRADLSRLLDAEGELQ